MFYIDTNFILFHYLDLLITVLSLPHYSFAFSSLSLPPLMLIAFPFLDFFLWFWYWFWFSNVYLIRLNRGSIRFGFDSMRDLIDVPTNWSISIVIIKIVHSWFHSFVSFSLSHSSRASLHLSLSPLSLHSIVTLSFIRIDLLLSSCIPSLSHRIAVTSVTLVHWRDTIR